MSFSRFCPTHPHKGACVVADRVRMMASSAPIVTHSGHELYVTVSIGCATRADATDLDYVQRADEALYSAKNLGLALLLPIFGG